MNHLEQALLFYIMRYTATEGEYVITRNDIAAFCDCTTATAKKYVQPLIDAGYVEEHKKLIKIGLGYKYVYHMTTKAPTPECQLWFACEWSYDDFRHEKMLRAMKKAVEVSKPRGKPKKVSEKQLKLGL